MGRVIDAPVAVEVEADEYVDEDFGCLPRYYVNGSGRSIHTIHTRLYAHSVHTHTYVHCLGETLRETVTSSCCCCCLLHATFDFVLFVLLACLDHIVFNII